MKTSFRFSLYLVLLITSIFSISAERPLSGFVLTMYQQYNVDDPKLPTVPDEEGNRKPSRPIMVTIDRTNGVTMSGYNTEDVLAYEVFTVDGYPVASFVDQEDFITFIFSSEGTYEIRFQFEEITLAGFINL